MARNTKVAADPDAPPITQILAKFGITSHTFAFDDTHLKTIIHPAGPVASALFALDADLELKFHSLADPVIGKVRFDLLIEACWKLGTARDVRTLAERARP